MISCQKCEFKILPKMRFALVKNFCPSCGSSLLSDLDSQEINVINKKLQAQDFMISLSNQLSKELIQNLVYDLSIFFKFDLQKEYYKDRSVSNDIEIAKKEVTEEVEEGDDVDELSTAKRVFKPISRNSDGQAKPIQQFRRALDDEESSSEDDDSDLFSEDDDEDVDERVKRLKKAYQNSPTLKKFRGVMRSDEG